MQNIAQPALSVTVGDINLDQIIYKGQPVVTLDMIDKVHQRPEGTARKRFNDNRKRFTEGVDFFLINHTTSEKRTLDINISPRGSYLLTQIGYSMLVKSFTDDLAWQVQHQLVHDYFSVERMGLTSEAFDIFEGYTRICDCIGITGNQKAIAANQATIKHTGVNALESMGMTHLIADKQRALLTVSAIGKRVGLSAIKLNLKLIEMGLQTKHRDHKEKMYYEITDAGDEYGQRMDTGRKHNSGCPVTQIKWYSDVIELIQDHQQEKLTA
jgi:uncharacterized lipoprotein NlpE involved in copper resistance